MYKIAQLGERMKQHAKIEYLPESRKHTSVEYNVAKNSHIKRLLIFIISFAICLVFGLIVNFSRVETYKSSAILLTSAATSVDQRSSEVDYQHVYIQKQKLLGLELLSGTLARVGALHDSTALTVDDLRNMLYVEEIDETNVLKMSATGSEPELLPLLVNCWVDAYLEIRALNVSKSATDTVNSVKSELLQLESKIVRAGQQLTLFRKKYDISSIVREENESPAILKALTRSFNTAREDLVKAEARLGAVNTAITRGQSVVPEQEQEALVSLEKRHQELTERLAAFDKRYTRDYLNFKNSLKYIPEQIKQLENEIRKKQKEGKNIVLSKVKREYFAAQKIVTKMRQQLDNHKKGAVDFTALFSKHQSLMNDLDSLQTIKRESKERLVKIESKQFENYPQVDVLERASLNRQAIAPDYNRGALIVLGTSFVFAFFIVWLIEFLTKKQNDNQGVNFSFPTWFRPFERRRVSRESKLDTLEQEKQNGLPHLPTIQKISDNNLSFLIDQADDNTKQLILLIMSGMSCNEIAELQVEHIDVDGSIIEITGEVARSIVIGEGLQKMLTKSIKNNSLWGMQAEITETELNAMIYCLIIDVGLKSLESVNADTLRQSYILYLVEQGVKLTLLNKIVGYQSPLDLAAFAEFSPAGQGYDLEQIELIHPSCY